MHSPQDNYMRRLDGKVLKMIITYIIFIDLVSQHEAIPNLNLNIVETVNNIRYGGKWITVNISQPYLT